MSKNEIKCDFYDYETKAWNQYELDLNLNVYPCCFFYLKYMRDNKSAESIKHIDNSLKTNNLENILLEFNKIFNEDVWKSENCPNLCKATCSVK